MSSTGAKIIKSTQVPARVLPLCLKMNFKAFSYVPEQHEMLYRSILKPRMIEEKMLILLRQGKVSKWFSGIGQEAIAAGVAAALKKDEYILPLHRNLGVFTGRDIPLSKLIAQWQGKKEGFTKGRDRSFHFGTNEFHLVGMISHLGAMLGVADGIALADKLDHEKKVTLVFSGDGGSSEGDFHEAINVAAVWDLPVIFLIENNGYGLSTPSNEQFRFKSFTQKGPAYGIEAEQIDGNNVLAVYDAISRWSADIRENPRPVIIECMTFRMRGHEEASGTKYVPEHLFEEWSKKDPVENYERFLLKKGVLNEQKVQEIRQEIKLEIEKAVQYAFSLPEIEADAKEELADVYAKYSPKNVKPSDDAVAVEMRMVDAFRDGLRQSMERYPELVIMGQDVAEYGGVFKITDGFVDLFGKDRVRNTPLCESAIIGAAYGLSIRGKKAVVEMQFADFVSVGFNQIVNNLAKSHYRWGQQADVVIRMPTGAGVNAGPFHSQSDEAWFFHVPGLKILYPSNAYDAKGLLMAAINDPNPVMVFEHKKLYRSIKGMVPEEPYELPIGKGKVVQEGDELTVITYGWGVHWALEVAESMQASIEVIDLRSLLPWDQELVAASVKKCGKVLVLHEDTITGGVGAEIAAWISEHCFEYLDAPVRRLGSLDTPIPFAATLEAEFLPVRQLPGMLSELLDY